MAGLAVVAVACSSDDAVQQQDAVPVRLAYTTLRADATRAAADTDLNTDFIESGKQVRVRIANTGTTGWEPFVYTTGSDGALELPSPAPCYPLDGTNIDIIAYYPADASTSFSIQADQTTDENYMASDLMWAPKLTNVAKTTTAQTLQFTHKMAKFVVTATAGMKVKEINSVTLMGIKPTVSFSQGNGSTGVASGTATDVLVVKDEHTVSVSGAALIPQQELDGQFLAIGVTMPDGTESTACYSVSSKTFTAGKVYKLNLTVNHKEVGTTNDLSAWAEGSTYSQTPSDSPFLSFTVGDVEFKMVYVEGTDDDITMTWGNYNTSNNQSPNNVSVTVQGLSDYYMGQTEVTNALWNAVMGSKPGTWSAVGTNNGQPNDGDSYPVAYVSWEQICNAETGFLDKLNAAVADQLPTGMKFVLPSEAQWQYAAQGGKYSNRYTYSGSNTINDVAWYGNGGTGTTSGKTTNAVATKPANELGLYDMSGNVWELCLDWYNVKEANAVLPKDYVDTTTASYRVIRGGGWNGAAVDCTVSCRNYRTPSNPYYGIGFRLALVRTE